MEVPTIVGHLGGRCKGECEEQEEWTAKPTTAARIKEKVKSQVDAIFSHLERKNDDRSFDEVERGLIGLVFALGRLLLAYYCARREESSEGLVKRCLRRGLRRKEKERKFLNTCFGRVCVWRTYVRHPHGRGFHPLDAALKLTADGFSFLVMSMAARLSTLLSYEQVTGLLLYFNSWSPSKTSVEKAVLGFGRFTQEWFESAPAPQGDGEVLVIQIDSKATPTATEEELEKRRGKRQVKNQALSPRHRGRQKRERRGPRKRRKPGDKSKNGKAATIVTMYTLKKGQDEEGKPALLGPINKRAYSSYAPKRHAFAVARRDADKRGFARKSGKTVQIVTDGDEDFERYVQEFFPEARHTLDIVHVLEYVWEAGRLGFREGSEELTVWVKKQERLLYQGKALLAIQHICDFEPKVGSSARSRLQKIRGYLMHRVRLMNYHELRKEDLEVASGAVEGAVRHVIAKRFDFGSMRWIRERAEPLLQLRCIEINGDWPAFEKFVQSKLDRDPDSGGGLARLLTTKPGALPTYGIAA
jgi:hypothetical protein